VADPALLHGLGFVCAPTVSSLAALMMEARTPNSAPHRPANRVHAPPQQ
jgi:hypothetical protein